MLDRDVLEVKNNLELFKSKGKYDVPLQKLEKLKETFLAYFVDDNLILNEIDRVYKMKELKSLKQENQTLTVMHRQFLTRPLILGAMTEVLNH